MIKINLLPHKKVKPLDKGTVRLRIGAVALIVATGLILAFMMFNVTSKKSSLNARKELVALQLSAIKNKVKEVEGYEKSRKELDQKLKTIQALQMRRVLLTNLLNELNSLCPKEVWFTSLHVSGPSFDLDCMARDSKSNIDVFVGRLNGTHVLADVKLVDVKEDAGSSPDNRKFAFKVSGRMAGYEVQAAKPVVNKDKKVN